MNSQDLHIVWFYIAGEGAGETWSLFPANSLYTNTTEL